MERRRPSFIHYDKYRKGIEMLFSVWKAPTPEIKEILSLVPITEGIAWAIQGPPGTGKSAFIKTMAKIFYEGKVANIKLDESLMPDDVLFFLDLPKLLREGKEEVHPRPILTSWLKWANEMMTRANQTVKNAFLGLLAEGEVIYKDKVLKASSGIFVDDYNRYLIGSLEEADRAFLDRHDVNVNIPLTGFREDVELILLKYGGRRHARDISELVEPVLSELETKEICKDVKRVEVPVEVAIWTTMLLQAFKVCKYKRSLMSPMFRLDCENCEFNSEPCADLKAPVSTRAIDSVIALAKARAWSHHRDAVNINDILFVLPYVLNHRLLLKPEKAVQYLNEEEYAKEVVRSLFERKWKIWSDAARNYVAVAKASISEASRALDWFDEYEKKDLVVRKLGEWARAIFRGRCKDLVKKVKSAITVFKREGYRIEDVDEALSIVKHIPEEREVKEELKRLRDALTVSFGVTEKAFFEKVIPSLAVIDEEVASELSALEERGEKKVESRNVKGSVWLSEGEVRGTLTFRRSVDAEEFRKALK